MDVTHEETRTIMTRHFTGDILITDPCYIIKKVQKTNYPTIMDYLSYEDITKYSDYDGYDSKQRANEREQYYKACNKWEEENDDWAKSDYGFNCGCLGINNYITNDTLYGDWSCTVYDKNTEEILGEFCADAGLVSVFLLDEVRAYNPDIDNWIKDHPWCVTVIKNFSGDVSFDIVHTEWVWDTDSDYHKAGDTCEDDILIVHGEGTTNFTTRQTGL